MLCALLLSVRLMLPLCYLQKCTHLAAIMVRVQGPHTCDLLYAATNKQVLRCGVMSLATLYIQHQLAMVSLHTASVHPMLQPCMQSMRLCLTRHQLCV